MLTDARCRTASIPPGKERVRFADAGGLNLEVSPTSKRWFWKYRLAGKEKRLALGKYPDVALGAARLARDRARGVLKAGSDPVQDKRDARAAERLRLGTTFEAVARSWLEAWKTTKTPRHADYVLRRLEADVFPVLGAKPLADVTAPQLVAMAKRIEARGAADLAKRSLQTCGQVFRYGVAHGLCERNPAADVKPADALRPTRPQHYARLDAKELPDLMRRIEVYDGSPTTRLAIKLMALTFVRTGELIGARWDEFDLKAAEWRLPAERMKMRTQHIVPLSSQAVEVMRCLAELRRASSYVFPGERDHEKPMSNDTILMALGRMGYKHRMTGHGFRGIALTVLHELGFDHMHIELQLAHIERNRVSAAYNFATYLPQRRKMMQTWADHVDAVRAQRSR